ncbi:hypothetical protein JST97_35635 [bacterium]|nr:hypothetical protein [bacterium]
MAEASRERAVEELLRLRRVWPGSAAELLQLVEEQLAARPRSISVRLDCGGGQTLQGQVVRYQPRTRTLLLADQGRLSWVNLDQVVAITLVDVDPWLEDLTRGLVREALEPAPTRLQLRRQAEQLLQHLQLTCLTVPWSQIPEDDQSSRHLQLLLNEIQQTWQELAGDQMGREALQGVRKIVLIPSVQMHLRVEGDSALIQIEVQSEGLLAFPPGSLRRLLEKAL